VDAVVVKHALGPVVDALGKAIGPGAHRRGLAMLHAVIGEHSS